MARDLFPRHTVAEAPPAKNTSVESADRETFDSMTTVADAEGLRRLRLALETVRQQAKILNEEITREMARLGLPSPTTKVKS